MMCNYNFNTLFLLVLFISIFSIDAFSFDFISIDSKIKIIELSSRILPNIDTIGHNLLLNNEIVIKNVLHVESVPLDVRKQIVLDIIRVTEYGDKFGGFILSHYHDIVEKLL